jgi:predicted DsbA family dithiol-disulfide isomerase
VERFGARIDWQPYDLHPEYPPEGLLRAERARRVPPEADEAVRRMFAEAGFAYAPHPEKIPRTRRALELGEAARAEGVHPAYHDAVMDAYWRDSRDISDPDVLRELATTSGVSPEGIARALDDGGFADAVDASTAVAQQAGIMAVPAFVIERAVLVSGAQPHAVFEGAVETARQRRRAS